MADLFGRLCVALLQSSTRRAKKRGDVVDFRCPRHDDHTPSAWMKAGSWGCHACGFTEPLRTLAGELGIDVGPAPGYTVADYASEKALPEAMLRSFGVSDETINGRAVVAIPYYDAEGNILRRKFRGSRGAKWWEGRGMPVFLYGVDRIAELPEGAEVIIVEGESDCHAGWVHGFSVVGVPGANTWKPEWAQYLRGFTLYVWEEQDKGGSELVRNVSRDFPDIRVIVPPDGVKDMADLHAQKGARFTEALRHLMAMATKPGTPRPPVVFDAMLGDVLDRLIQRKQEPIDAVPTPFPMWNNFCRGRGGRVGLARGWYVIAAAKSGRGKSILALNLAAKAMTSGERVCFVSMEMDQDELATRLLSIGSEIPIRNIEQGRDFNLFDAKRAAKWLDDTYARTGGCIFLNRSPVTDLAGVMDSMRYHHEIHGCRYFLIDYIQLASKNPGDLETIARVSNTVRELTVDMRVVTVALSQFNRQTSISTERPRKEGLMGGSPLENDAQQVVLIDHSRVERTNPPDPEGWRSYLLLDKNRHGPEVEIPVALDTRTLRFRELMPDEQPSQAVA